MASDIIFFGPGPAKIPNEVLLEAQKEFISYGNTHVSAMEISHRSADFKTILTDAQRRVKELLNVPDNYKILFMHGGGTGQFAAVPLNLMWKTGTADYFVTGSWSAKAAKEAAKFGKVNHVIPKTVKYTGIPEKSTWKLDPNASYVYYCDNETVDGVEFQEIPDTKNVPLVVDMSSNIMTRKFDVAKYGIVLAGAQKNIGCAGVSLVIVREDLIGHTLPLCPGILDYTAMAKENSLLNTPPTYNIYILGLVMKWIEKNGGVEAMEKNSAAKSKLIGDAIHLSNEFYYCPVDKKHCSRVTIPFRVGGPDGDDKLEKEFLAEAKKRGMLSLEGHRTVGGIRVSLYNAITIDNAKTLAAFMKEFYEKHH